MKRMAMMFCIVVVALVLIQSPAKAQFGIYGGIALPIGDFASTDAKEASGNAALGFGGGIEYNVAFPAVPIGWLTSLSVTYNDLDTKNLKSQDVSLDYTPWLAGWLMTGVRVRVPAFPLFAQLQIGAVIAKAPEFTYKEGTTKYTYKADPVAAFGFSAGVGGGFGPVRITARYLSGTPEFDYKLEGYVGASGSSKPSKQISVFLISLGLEL